MNNSTSPKKKYRRKQVSRQQPSQISISTISMNSSVNLTQMSQFDINQSEVEIHNLSTYAIGKQKVKEYKFQYNFNQYLRLFIMKILPPRNDKIVVYPNDKTLKGPQIQSQELLKKIKQQFQLFTMKIVKYNGNSDFDQIQFHLQQKYDSRIYRKRFLKLVIDDVRKHYNLIQQSQSFLKKIESQQLILVRVQKKFEKSCIQDINNILKQQPTQLRKSISSSSSNLKLNQEQNQPTYYENHRDKQIKSIRLQHSNFLSNLMEEPTEEDSISVVGNKKNNNKVKKQKQIQKQVEPKKIQRPFLQREYQSQNFDRNLFQAWLKDNKILSQCIKIIQDKDPYSDFDCKTYKLQLFSSNIISDNQLIQALDVYLKFRKVIIFHLKNQKYRDQLIQKYQRDDQALSVKFIKGFKSPKWSQSQMWKHIIKKDYSQSKKSTNSQQFQLFYLQGLKNLVLQTQKEIRKQLQKEPSDDTIQQIMIKLDQISDHLRSNQKLKDMITLYVQKMMNQTYHHCCQLIIVQFQLAIVKILVSVKFQHQDQFQKNIKNQISDKIKNQIKVNQHKVDYPITRFLFEKLEKSVIIVKKYEKSFRYVSTFYNLHEIISEISNIFNSLNNVAQKELNVDDRVVVKKLQERFAEIKQQKEYSQINFNYNPSQSKFKLYGKQYLLGPVLKRLQECKAQILSKRINYIQIAKKKEADLLQDGTFLKDIYDKYQILINTRKSQIACKIVLEKSSYNFKKKNILIVKSKSLDYAPYGCVIAFKNVNQIDLFQNYFLKAFRNYISKHKQQIFHENTRKYTFLLKDKGTGQILKDALAVNPNIANHVVMIMPQNGKDIFLQQIVKVLQQQKQYASRQLTVMIIQYGQSADIQQSVNISPYTKGKKIKLKDQIVTKYYVEDKGLEFYFSQSGNRKILTAKQKGFHQIILNNEDLNITRDSHEIYPQTLQIIHLQSKKIFPLKITNNKVEFILKNQLYDIPPPLSTHILNCIYKQTNPIKISLGVYQIDLLTMKQTNLFSDFSRPLHKKEILVKADVNQDQIQAFYNYKVAQIQYSYYFEENIMANFSNSRTVVFNYLAKNIKQKQISYKDYKNIEMTQIQGIKSAIEDDEQTQCCYNHHKKIITFKTLDDKTSSRCQQMIKLLLNNLNQRNDPNKIKYPDQWQPQKEDIQIFDVKQNSKEFQNVQAKFTVGKIKQLFRIQNKIIYKKYYEESIFLQTINGGKIKTMQLFHGTRSTNPQQIYRDKQESFNINYSSDNNLLGKGIYFAEKSEYSNDYRYGEVVSLGKIFSIGAVNLYSMFLCEVLVGSSEKCKQHNGAIKDTNYKDPIKKIRFESMTDYLNNSNIYVVYKSRRAYPLYLIKY